MSQNIILISWDSVRADHLNSYGYDRVTTPNLDAMMDVVFDDTFVSGVGTPTSFSGAFTGEHAQGIQTNISPDHWKQSNQDRRLLSEAMQDAGYYTGGIHANALMSRHYGWNRGWDDFYDNMWTKAGESNTSRGWNKVKKTKLLPALRKLGLAGSFIHARNIALKKPSYAPWESLWQYVEDFVRKAPEPWFLWVLLIDTHHPWCPPDEYQLWQQPGFRKTHLLNYIMQRWPNRIGERDTRIVNAYDNELVHADAFMDELVGLLDKTRHSDVPMIMHSDHGDELGEHGDYGHRPAMWDTVTHVPLMMRNVGQTGRVEGPHSLLNLGSTVLDLADIEERLSGKPSYFDKDYDPDTVYIENRKMDGSRQAAITDGTWKVTYDRSGVDAYNRQDDPREQTPRLNEAPNELIRELSSRVSNEYDAIEANEELDPETMERLEELGYL